MANISPKTILRWSGAAIAALVTGLAGEAYYGAAWAASPNACTLKDVSAFQQRILEPQEEASPSYFLKVATAFIEQCPDRFEVREAHLIAARGALDSGLPDRAVQHYQRATDLRAPLSISELMAQSAALMATRGDARAKAVRDSGVANWASQLTANSLARFSALDVPGGTLYEARLDAVDPEAQILHIWLAVPSEGGHPAAVVIRPAKARAAWRSLRLGAEPQALTVAELVQCHGRDVLFEQAGNTLAMSGVRAGAVAALTTYLQAPSTTRMPAPGRPVASCHTVDVMMHVPNRFTAVPVH